MKETYKVNFLLFSLHKYQLCTVCARDISKESEIELPLPNWTERQGEKNLSRHVNNLKKTKVTLHLFWNIWNFPRKYVSEKKIFFCKFAGLCLGDLGAPASVEEPTFNKYAREKKLGGKEMLA